MKIKSGIVVHVCNLISSKTEVGEITVFRPAWTVVPVKQRKKMRRTEGKCLGEKGRKRMNMYMK